MAERTPRQREILDLACQLFCARGYAATSMRDLATAAGVLPGSLYAHFRSKAEILGAIVEDFFDEALPAQETGSRRGGRGLDRMISMLDDLLPVIARRSQDFLVVSSEWATVMGESVAVDAARKASRSLEIWTSVVVDGQSDGSLRRDIPADVLVAMSTFALVGAVLFNSSQPGSTSLDVAVAALPAMLAATADATVA